MHNQQVLLPEVAAQFCPVDSALEWRALGSGHIHDTFLLRSATAPLLVLQRLNTQVFPQPERIVDTHLKVYQHLIAQPDFPLRLPAPVPTITGDWLYRDSSGSPWRALAFLEGTYAVEQSTSPAQIRQSAEAVAIFLCGLKGLDPANIEPALPGFHDSLARLVHFEAAIANNAAERLKHVTEEVAYLRAEAEVFHLVKNLNFPARVVHTDPKIGNLLFDAESHAAVAVLDWDTIMGGAIPGDFGDMVRAMAGTAGEAEADLSKVQLNDTLFRALVEGFLPPLAQVITPLEINHLVTGARWIILEQMMRFLTDYLNGDVYYKTAYAEHNLVRSRNQMTLYQAVKRKELALNSMVKEVFEKMF
jgi:Ser/Thr protein kinase RdoA (MazF antagonist)